MAFTKEFIWFNYPAVVSVELLSLISLFDVYFMAMNVIQCKGNPYVTICKYLLCHWCKDEEEDVLNYKEYFYPSSSDKVCD